VEQSQISEIAALMASNPIAPTEPLEEGTAQVDSEAEELPLAAEGDAPKQSPVDDEPEKAEPEPLTAKGIAEKLGISAKDFYARYELVPGMSLGKAKDQAKKLLQVDEMLSSAEDKRISSENELIRKQQEYQLSLSDQNLTQEEVAQRWEATVKAANSQAIDTIDGWADEKVRTSDLKAIRGLLLEYGYSVAQADSLIDPVQLRLLTDYARLRNRVKVSAVPVKQSQQQNRANANQTVLATADKAVSQYNKGEISQNAAVVALMKG